MPVMDFRGKVASLVPSNHYQGIVEWPVERGEAKRDGSCQEDAEQSGGAHPTKKARNGLNGTEQIG